jgi:hypothetical protein
MNEELKALVLQAGCPEEIVDQFWFSVFIKNYSNILLDIVERAENDE